MAVLPGDAPRAAVGEAAEALPLLQRTGFLVDVGIVAAAAAAEAGDAASAAGHAAVLTARRSGLDLLSNSVAGAGHLGGLSLAGTSVQVYKVQVYLTSSSAHAHAVRAIGRS